MSWHNKFVIDKTVQCGRFKAGLSWRSSKSIWGRFGGGDGNRACEQVCECFEPEDAQKIAAALNGSLSPFQAEQVQNVRRAAEAGLKAAQTADDSANVDRFQHIIDLVATIRTQER